MLTGAQAVARRLRARGYRLAFAYPGTSELHLCAALDDEPGLTVIRAWGDREAAFMACGANLLNGATAVSVLHGARGLTNALGAIADTRRSETPSLHIVGMASRSSQPYLPPHAESRLLSTAGRFASDAFDCTHTELDADAFLSKVDTALDAAGQFPSGPVLLGIPQDFLETPFVPAKVTRIPRQPPAHPAPDLTGAVRLLAAATNPVIMVDDYLLTPRKSGEAALGAFARHIGAPVLQVAYRRGPMLFQQIDPVVVPTFAGPYDPAEQAHRAVLESADLLITVEDRNMYPRVVGRFPSCRKIAITSNADLTRKNGYLSTSDIVVEGEPAEILLRLAKTVPLRHPAVPVLRVTKTVGCTSALLLVDAIGRLLADTNAAALVDDSQSFGGIVARNMHRLPAGIPTFGSHGGFVGSGLPVATGIAIAANRTIVCLLGDHGFLNSVQALAAAAAQSAAVLAIICNNGGSHSLDLESLSRNEKSIDHQNRHADYTAIARGYGVDTLRIDWPTCNADEQRQSAAMSKLERCSRLVQLRSVPIVVEIRTPSADEDFWQGVWRVDGFE